MSQQPCKRRVWAEGAREMMSLRLRKGGVRVASAEARGSTGGISTSKSTWKWCENSQNTATHEKEAFQPGKTQV